LERIERGDGAPDDIERALKITRGIDGNTFCPMGAALVNPARSTIAHFRDEYETHIQQKKCIS
jgi:NADH-quinone oxidoreductase subunit F